MPRTSVGRPLRATWPRPMLEARSSPRSYAESPAKHCLGRERVNDPAPGDSSGIKGTFSFLWRRNSACPHFHLKDETRLREQERHIKSITTQLNLIGIQLTGFQGPYRYGHPLGLRVSIIFNLEEFSNLPVAVWMS